MKPLSLPAAVEPARIRAWLLWGNALVAALLVAAVAIPLKASRELQVERAIDATANIARTLSQTIHADVSRMDLGLQAVVAAGPQRAIERVGTLRQWLPEAAALRVTDERGISRIDGSEDVSDRAFFKQAVQAAAGAGPALSEPWQRSAGGPWVITLARALRSADGQLWGVVYGDLRADQLGRRFEGVDIGSDGAITLRTTKLALVARQTARGPGTTGIGSANVSAALQAALRADAQRGEYVATVASDNIERANAYERVGGYPLLVVAGLGTSEFLAAWRQHAWQAGAMAAVLLFAVAAASRQVYRGWRREATARDALALQSDRYRTLLLTANDGIHILSKDARLIECNAAFATMLGRTPEELVGVHVIEWDANYEAGALEAWLATFNPGRKRRTSSRWRHADGSLFDVAIHSAAMELEGRTVVLCAARDITDSLRLQASTALSLERAERSEQFLQAITDNVPLRMAYVDRHLRFRFVNRAHLERFGLLREQILGRTRAELARDPAPGRASTAIEAALSGQPQQFEFHETVAGQDRVIESRLVPDIAPDGRVRGVYTVGHDVTERHTQQRRIEEALAERETLLREVYHRVKNNLQMVQSLLSLQRHALPEGPAREALAESSQRVRAMSLVHEQLYQTRSLAAVDLRDYTAELLKRLGEASGIRGRGIDLKCEIEAGREAALDQAVPFGLLVTELVLNSLKHAFGEGGGTVWVAIDSMPVERGHCMRLTVRDNGSGLPADFDLARREADGSIGLQLAASLSTQLGGTLQTLPSEGRGAAFVAVLTRLVV